MLIAQIRARKVALLTLESGTRPADSGTDVIHKAGSGRTLTLAAETFFHAAMGLVGFNCLTITSIEN